MSSLAVLELPQYLGEACPLSPSQLEYVKLLASGMRVLDAAKHVHKSPRTVINQLSQARARTGCRTNEHLVAKALGKGWLQ